jgi:hypothetical protein
VQVFHGSISLAIVLDEIGESRGQEREKSGKGFLDGFNTVTAVIDDNVGAI